MIILKIYKGNNKIKELSTELDTITIGNGNKNTIVIKEENISDIHCSIIKGKNGYYIRAEKGSVLLNGMRVEEANISNEDIINIGGLTIQIQYVEKEKIIGYLYIIDGNKKGEKFILFDTANIGRSPSSDIFIDDPSVSKFHARIVVKGKNVYVEDLGSRNGTFVNNINVHKETLLNDKDIIQFGDVKMIFLVKDISPQKIFMPQKIKRFSLVIIFLIFLLSVLLYKSEKSKEIISNYNNLIKQAEEYENNKEYLLAIDFYKNSLKIKYEKNIEDKIVELEKKYKEENILKYIEVTLKDGYIITAESLINSVKDTFFYNKERLNEYEKMLIEKKYRSLLFDSLNKIFNKQSSSYMKDFLVILDTLLKFSLYNDEIKHLFDKSIEFGDHLLLNEKKLKVAENFYKEIKNRFSNIVDTRIIDERLKLTEIPKVVLLGFEAQKQDKTPPQTKKEKSKEETEIRKQEKGNIPEQVNNIVQEYLKKGDAKFEEGKEYEENYYNSEAAKDKYKEALNNYETALKMLTNYKDASIYNEILEKIKKVSKKLEGL